MQLQHILRHPPRYFKASILCSLGGFLFGMDTGIIGPVTVMKAFTDSFGGAQSAIVHGLIVSSILIPAAISSFFGGRLADAVGRGKGIAVGSAIFGAGAALEAGAAHIAMFVVGRVIEGIGEGLYLGALVVYICEIVPPSSRGALATVPQLMITLGLTCGFFLCYGTADIKSTLSWRLPYALLAAFSFAFATAAACCLPHSPRWLTFHGRHAEARATWDLLDVNPADREKAEDQIQEELQNPSPAESINELNLPPEESKKKLLLDIFSRDARGRTLLALFLLSMQQLSGIDGVLYYAPLLFEQAGLGAGSATFLASGVSAIVIFTVTIPATIFADSWGRRINTILGGLGISAIMFLIGGLYAGDAVHANRGAGRWLVVVSIYLFAVVFSVTWAVGIKVYVTEIQPQRTRAAATNLAWGGNWGANFLVALVTPVLLARSSFGAYFLFGGCSLLTALVCLSFMPETRGKSLEEIEAAFRSSSLSSSVSRSWTRAVKLVFNRTKTAVVES